MAYTFYEMLWIFIVYAILGWCAEVAFAAWQSKTFVNRGFLNGPYCPIYGVGMLIVALVLTPLQDSLVMLFVGSFFLTSVLELLTGFVLEKFFDDKWWDYSNFPCNIKGYVCLRFSVLWGVGGTLVMRVLHPLVMNLIRRIPHTVGVVILIVFFVLFATDLGMTISTLLHLKKQVRMVTELNRRMKELSNTLGEGIFNGTMTAMEVAQRTKQELSSNETLRESGEKLKKSGEKAKERMEDSRKRLSEELEELKKKYAEVVSSSHFGTRRLLKAFPNVRNGKQQEVFDALDKGWKRKKKKNMADVSEEAIGASDQSEH